MRFSTYASFALAALAAATLPQPTAAQGPPCQGEARSFDFWIGEWDVLNRNRPPEEPNWYDTGIATDRVYTVAAGCGLVEHRRGNAGGEFLVGFSLRSFNPQTGQWDLILLWPNAGVPHFGELRSGFRHSRGEFYSGSVSAQGDTAISRLTFSDVTPNTLRWQNGTSSDGGRSWSSNWIMEFNRRDDLYQGPLLNGPTPTTDRCPGPEHRSMDFLIGEWSGASPPDAPDETAEAVRAQVFPILEGCGIMESVIGLGAESAWEVFRVRAFEPTRNRWVEYRIDTRWPVIQRLEADVPAEGQPWVFQSPRETPADGDLRVSLSRGIGGSLVWTEERYNTDTSQWEASPDVAYNAKLGGVGTGG